MKLGIIGLPQSGKTTLFNAVSGQQEAVGDFSRTVHRAVIRVPDKRLDDLATLYKPGKVTHTEIEFLDAAGFSGRGKQSDVAEITPELRLMDAIVLVVDCFSEGCNPESDVQTIIDEMILADLMVTENNVDKLARTVQLTGKKDRVKELDILKRCHETLNEEKTLSEIDLSEEELKEIRGYAFLTLKPVLLVFNIPEARLSEAEMIYAGYEKYCREGVRDISVICGKIEMEIAALPEEEQGEFLEELGIDRPATAELIRKSHHLLGLISFFTLSEPECRAWNLKKGCTALEAAGTVHTDFARGFIKAEVASYDDFMEHGSLPALKTAGKLHLEGKEYIVRDGDCILFRFNV